MTGTAARLARLEDRDRVRVAAVEDAKAEQWKRAVLRLPDTDRAALHEHLDVLEAGGAWWAEVCRAAAALEGPPLEDPAGEAARAWSEAVEGTPEGVTYTRPPVGAVAYFEREAARCDAVKADARGEVLPDGVSLEAVQTVARWFGAWWRYEAAFALELGEGVQA
ncbi:hypothetical protein [Deinococcus altitudinis]|uniref:hypothetical protein n=1 Tax=Deinococcus altitudinis TaxID=468914 RepID=UPI0038928D3F